jgi:hypothetical protein
MFIVLSEFERWVSIFEFKITPSHDEAPSMPFEQIIPRITSLFDRGEAVNLYSNGTRAFRISDLHVDEVNRAVTMLIQLSDTNMSDPVFSHLDSGVLRVEPKLDGEGIALSAHMLIKMDATDDSVDHYKVVIENIPGITRSRFQPFLKWLLRKAYEDEEFVSQISRKTYKIRPELEVISYVSETLDQSLAGATLQGFRLLKTSRVENVMDQTNFTRAVEKSIKFKMMAQPDRQQKRTLIETMRARGDSDGYNKLVISYARDGKQSSIELDTREDAGVQLFTKTEKILVPSGISQCEQSIHNELEESMVRILNS